MLRDEAGGHVSSLKLRVARKTQQKVNVGVQSYNLRTIRMQRKLRHRTSYKDFYMYLLYNKNQMLHAGV